MRTLVPLGELFPAWSAEDPQSLTEVWNADSAELSGPARELRRHIVDVRNSFDSAPIAGPEDVRSLIERRLIKPLPGAWLTIPLDAERRRILAPVPTEEALSLIAQAAAKDDMRGIRRALSAPGATRWAWASHVTRKVPAASALDEAIPLDASGAYLIVFAGSPSVLEDTSTAEALHELLRSAPVVDVVFWQTDHSAAPSCFSLGIGRGECAGEAVEFPSTVDTRRLRAALNKEEA